MSCPESPAITAGLSGYDINRALHAADYLRATYKQNDKEELKNLAAKIPALKAKYEKFHADYRAYWLTFNKPMGWETFDLYLGGAIKRFETVKQTLEDYIDGRTLRIEELEQEKLPYVAEEAGRTVSLTCWTSVATTAL